jgi:hypothetical protein
MYARQVQAVESEAVTFPLGSECFLIQMQGSDGAGSYFASLVITRNGKHSRFIDVEIP